MKQISEIQNFFEQNVRNKIPLIEKKKKNLQPLLLSIRILNGIVIFIAISTVFNSFFDAWDILPTFFHVVLPIFWVVMISILSYSLVFKFLQKKFPSYFKNHFINFLTLLFIFSATIVLLRLGKDTPFVTNIGPVLANRFDVKQFFKVFFGFFAIVVFIFGSTFLLASMTKSFKIRDKKFRLQFKDQVISPLMKFIDEKFIYKASGSVPIEDFADSKLSYLNDNDLINKKILSSDFLRTTYETFNDGYQSIKIFHTGEDYVSGIIGETSFQFSQLDISKEEIKKSSSSYEASQSQVFRGLLYVADFNKNFSGETFIYPDIAESLFGNFGTHLQELIHGSELVKLENPEFEEYFVVISTDQIEARYILSPSLMERIVQVRKKFNKEIKISFRNSKIYIAIPSDDIFAPEIFGRTLDFENILEYSTYIELLFGLVDELNLNTRIWTK